MTRKEAIENITLGHCDDVFYKKDYEEAVNMAIEALEQESNTWSLDDAREDFMFDVYSILDFLPTNDEANRIIEIFDRVTSSIRQNSILDKIRAEIEELDEYYDNDYFSGNKDAMYKCNEVLQIIDKHKVESEE